MKTLLKCAGMFLVLAGMSATALAIPPDVPEIDAGSMASALTLLSGGMLLLSGRRRKS